MSKNLFDFVIHKVKDHMREDIEKLDAEQLYRIAESDSEFWDLWMHEFCPFDPKCEVEDQLVGTMEFNRDAVWYPLKEITYKSLSLHARGTLVQFGQPIHSFIQSKIMKIRREQSAKLREEELQAEREQAARELELLKEVAAQRKEVASIQDKITFDLSRDFVDTVKQISSGQAYKIDSFFQEEALSLFVQKWALRKLGLKLDSEQALAAAEVTNHTKINARAGSGKTTVMCVRSALLIDLCSVSPSEIMMLAFNKSAALEMEDRLTRYLIALSGVTPIAQTLSNNQTSREVIAEVAEMNAIEIPWVMTFDSLARAIIESKGEIEEKTFIANEEKEVTRIVLELLADPHYRQEFKEVMLANFKDDWDQLIQLESGLSSADRDLLRRSLPRETYKGERVKSAGEKRIADFLFRSTIPYIYEKNVRVDGRKFKPDFTIEAGGRNLYIEYAGMLGDETYAKAFREKKEAFTKANFDFLVLVPSQIADESFEVKALAFLKKNGFEVSNSPLKPEDYWDEYLEAKFRRRFTEAVKMFINRIRQARVGAVEFYANRIDQLAMQDKVAYRFTLLAWKVYEKYASNMTSENTEDFKDVLQRAVTSVSNGSTKAIRRGVTIDLASLRYISVDEYQDFSELYDDLVRGMHNLTSGSAIFAVGDHWQSINSFMGASTELFDSFISRWVNARQREITFNYRSCEEVVEVGNNLMRNTHGSPSKVGSDSVGRVWLMDYETLVQGQSELSSKLGYEELGIIRILQHIFAGDPDSSVAILSRKNSIPWWYQGKNNNSFDNDLQDYLNLILRSIDISKHSKISIHTVHKFKGLEADRVIILDALDKSIPLIHNDWRFARIFGDSPSSILSEERRVFYVALTRARKELFVLTRSSRPSGFIADLKLSTNNWELFPPGSAGVRIVCNGNTFAIKPVLLKAGFQWYSPNKEWVLDITEFATNKSEGELLSAIRISKHYWVQSVKRVDDVSVYLELEGIRKVIDWTTQ